MWEGPDVEAAVVNLQLVALVALHHNMLVLLMPLKLPSLHSTAQNQACSNMLQQPC